MGLTNIIENFTRSKRSTQNYKPISQAGRAYNSIDDLPLCNFVKIICTGDLKWLIIEGNPAELAAIWGIIKAEYSDASGDTSAKHILQLAIEVETTKNTLVLIELIVGYLSVQRSEELIKILQNDFKFRLAYDDLERDLVRTISQAKTQLVKMEKAKAEYIKLTEKDSPPTNESSFWKTLQLLSKSQGYQISAHKITVREYLSLIEVHNDGRQ